MATRPRVFFIPLITLFALGIIRVAPVQAANCHFYAISIQGVASVGDGTTVTGSQQFLVGQYAMWRDAGVTSHPVEFYMSPLQDLNASPQVGYIELMTNSAFARNPGIASAQFDLATVSISNVISFQLDSGMSLQLPPPNILIAPGIGTVPGGLGGLGFLPGAGGELADIINGTPLLSVSYFIPRTGGGYFAFTDSSQTTIVGELNIMGAGVDNTTFQGQYQASFNGSYIGSVQCG
jgi:hypothetical protein